MTEINFTPKQREKILDDLYGNGSEGLMVRFARLETKVKYMLTIELLLLSGVVALVAKTFIG